ncbi:MAG: efflux RND transporter periplasmic adaptor subunit [candidate division Zixibacteria bacterium]|nr:efflux RND transporter periplasmic adaptor subunit [candidate division Zixibacteria bacterium]
MRPIPRLRTDLIESRQEEGGQTYYIVKDPRTQRFFRLRAVEHRIVQLLDGRASLPQIAAKMEDEFGVKLPLEQLERFVDKLDELLFLESEKSEKKLAAEGRKWERKDKTWLQKILFVKLKAFDPDALVAKLEKRFQFVFSPYFLALGLLLCFLAARVTVSRWDELSDLTLGQLFRAESILAVLLTIFITISLHEFAHAITLKHFGGEVRQMGFLLLYFQPCFYCDVSDAYLFAEKRKKILVTLAGVIFQIFLWSLSTLAWYLLPEGSALGHLFFIASAFTLLTTLFNLNPLIKLDGYYILTDWVGIPNLRAKAFGYLKAKSLELAFGVKSKLSAYTGRERRIFLWYGVLGLVYSFLFLGFFFLWLFRALTAAWRGLGFLLFSAFLLFIFAEPVKRTIQQVFNFFGKENVKKLSPTKLGLTLGLSLLFLIFFFFFPYPQTISGEAEIEPLASYTLSAPQPGVLEEKIVMGGQEDKSSTELTALFGTDFASVSISSRVKVGDMVAARETVAHLVSNQYENELKSNQAAYDQARAKLELLKKGAKPQELERLREAERRLKVDYEQKEREFKRSQQLFDRKAISQEEFQKFESEKNKAEAAWKEASQAHASIASGARPEELQQARAEMAKLEGTIRYLKEQLAKQAVVSPFPGRVTLVNSPQALLRIIRLDSVRVLTRVSEADLDLVKPDAAIALRLRSFPNKTYTGTVQQVGNEAEESRSQGLFKVAGVLANSDGRLRAGMSGKLKIHAGKKSLFKILGRSVVRFFKVEFWNWW